jgi:hypothetical protein
LMCTQTRGFFIHWSYSHNIISKNLALNLVALLETFLTA